MEFESPLALLCTQWQKAHVMRMTTADLGHQESGRPLALLCTSGGDSRIRDANDNSKLQILEVVQHSVLLDPIFSLLKMISRQKHLEAQSHCG